MLKLTLHFEVIGMMDLMTHRLVYTLAEDCQHEDSSDGRGQVGSDGLDVVKKLTTLSSLHHGDPCYAHRY